MLTQQCPTHLTVFSGLTNAVALNIYTPNWKEALGKNTVLKVSHPFKNTTPLDPVLELDCFL